jgi:iron-sulfur cluster assembly protein
MTFTTPEVEQIKAPHDPLKTLSMTPAARDYFLSLKKSTLLFSLSVKKTGCSGWEYVIQSEPDLLAYELTFTFKEGLSFGLSLVNFEKYFKNTTIDCLVRSPWDKKIVFNNPNEKHKCGCGESFDVY